MYECKPTLITDVPQSYADAGDTSEEQIHTAL